MIRIGTAGWAYEDWEGLVHPRPRPRGFHPLPHLARMFGCVELNSSFYAVPRAEHARRWVELVEPRENFRFLAKLHQGFTHGPELDAAEEADLVAAFRAGISPLAEAGRLSALLAQFPASFRATGSGAARLERLVATWSEFCPLAVELRHASWFTSPARAWLAELGVTLLHIDLPSAPDHPPEDFEPTSRLGYYRLHGRNREAWFQRGVGRDARYDHLYTPAELSEVVARARRLASEHDELFVVTNNHFEGKAVVAGLEIAAGLGLPAVEVPEALVERYPRLGEVARHAGQGRLF